MERQRTVDGSKDGARARCWEGKQESKVIGKEPRPVCSGHGRMKAELK